MRRFIENKKQPTLAQNENNNNNNNNNLITMLLSSIPCLHLLPFPLYRER
jgi:hypothetical protein